MAEKLTDHLASCDWFLILPPSSICCWLELKNNSLAAAINLLVEQHDVGLPHLVGGQPEHADAAVVRLVPLQLVIIPNLENFSCKSQHLIKSVWSGSIQYYCGK